MKAVKIKVYIKKGALEVPPTVEEMADAIIQMEVLFNSAPGQQYRAHIAVVDKDFNEQLMWATMVKKRKFEEDKHGQDG